MSYEFKLIIIVHIFRECILQLLFIYLLDFKQDGDNHCVTVNDNNEGASVDNALI